MKQAVFELNSYKCFWKRGMHIRHILFWLLTSRNFFRQDRKIAVTLCRMNCFISNKEKNHLKAGGENLDRQLLEEMYERYYREIYFYVYSLCGRKSMAEDVMQETFLKAFTALKDSHTNMRAWLYMVARNLCYNHMKKEKTMVLSGEVEESAGSPMEDVLDKVIWDEQKKELWKALGKLRSPRKDVLLLQYFGGFRQTEIAAMLHLTPENVRVLSYRAKRELKSYLEVRNYDIP